MSIEKRKPVFYGFKNSELVRSTLPYYREFMIELEFDSNVASYYQPEMDFIFAPGEDDSPAMRVDFCVHRRNEVSEFIHLYEESVDPLLLPKAIGYAAALGAEFRAVPVSEILVEPRRGNLKKLWRHARREVKNIHFAFIKKFFKEEFYPTVDGAKRFLKTNGFREALVYTLLFHRAVSVNLDDFPLTGDTTLMPNTELKYTAPGETSQHSFLELWKGFDPRPEKEDF